MIPINRTYAPIQAIVDELARCGMTHAVTSPGSRNAPIALTLAQDERIKAVSVIDERAAGFMALGMAKATGRPVAVTCTSGTAAANLMPAVIEAHEARVPLIVLTADRPPELRGIGAGQAIDQIKLYGSAVKWFCEVGNGEAGRDWALHVRTVACRAFATAGSGPIGPVHLNLPLREPLAPVPEELHPDDWAGRPDGRPWTVARGHSDAPHSDDVQVLAEAISTTPRGVIVAGWTGEDVAEAATRLAAASGWPILAEPTSGLRCGPHDRSHVICHYDVLLRSEKFAAAADAGLVVRIGDPPTSKAYRAWEARRRVFATPENWLDPTRGATDQIDGLAAELVAAVASAVEVRGPAIDPEWLDRWHMADELVLPALDASEGAVEPQAYVALKDALPPVALVWVASSMPIRHVESFFPPSDHKVRFLSNRGANGIDGTIASAAGAALATGTPTFVLIGDVALGYDAGGLMAAARAGAKVGVLCVNNGGGGIFDFLPVAESGAGPAYEEHVATAGELDMGALARLGALEHVVATGAADAAGLLGPGLLVELKTDRAAAVTGLRSVVDAVSAGL